MNLAKKHRK